MTTPRRYETVTIASGDHAGRTGAVTGFDGDDLKVWLDGPSSDRPVVRVPAAALVGYAGAASDPCINWSAPDVPCGHLAEEHDEDGCLVCECGVYVTDGAEA